MKSGMLSFDDSFTRPVPDRTLGPSVNRAQPRGLRQCLNGFSFSGRSIIAARNLDWKKSVRARLSSPAVPMMLRG